MTEHAKHTGKRLFILRHALAASSTSGDADRPLAAQGVEDAKALGQYMQAQNYIPDLVLCSNAVRTRQTWDGIAKTINTPKALFLDALYAGSTGEYLYALQKNGGQAQNILIMAHNPSIYELAVLLSGQGRPALMQRLGEGYKPATLSVLNIHNEEWNDLSPAQGELVAMADPVDYNAPDRPTRWM